MNRTSLSSGSTSRRLPALLFVLLLCLVARTNGRPSTEDESDLAIIPPDADNVEIHKVKIVNGVMQEDHPVIMYKEDFVSEDYDPTKSETNPSHHKKHKRTRLHHAKQVTDTQKMEDQILFDILPDKPIVLEEDLKALPQSKVEAAQLAEPIKEEWLAKHPKKYHSRQRRQAHGSYEKVLQYYYGTPEIKFVSPLTYTHFRISVKGKKPHLVGPPNRRNQGQENIPTPDSVGSRGEFDLEHNSNQADADFSIYNRSSTTTPGPVFQINDSDFVTSAPSAQSAPSWRPPNGLLRPPPTRAPVVGLPTLRPNQRPLPQTAGVDSEPKVSRCVWAIVNCCTGESKKVRYNCFEEFGCHGAFWDINPCADEGVKQAELVPLVGFSPPVPAPSMPGRRPSSRKDAFQFPKDIGYQENSKCQRASKICCSQRNIESLFECFHHHGCTENLANIISTCS
ncbi:uncharacterized protein LOC6620082 isoform X1 [Drosophila sechellia]|uniref:GM15054 n=1 Tax=Drosophila sechellia TaxID=7238 RepID=B4IKN4_DROSE|nr:uncharacterized protein LOC6620082 isoform X1 [Drosophila sechellia]EDW51638.1 GM15054 [Drosophila sechellia]